MRRFLLLLFGWVFVGSSVTSPAAAPARPNVLFIAVDDLNDWIEPLGGRAGVITPNLSRLARMGMTFTNAQTASPGCHPSRVAMMTGVRPATSGILENVFHDEPGPSWREVPVLNDVPTLSQHFRNHGYHAAGAGKIFHSLQWWPGSENDPATWDEYWPAAHKPIPFQPRPPQEVYAKLQTSGFGKRPLREALFGWEPLHIPDEQMSDHQVVDWGIEQLSRPRDGSQPFFLAVGLFRPHIPWEVPQKYYDLYPLESLQLPEIRKDDLEDAFQHDRRSWHQWVLANDQWPQAVRGYLASITYCDTELGRLLDAFEQSPARESTILILWTDHGMHIGEKENWEKFTLWEESCRVPLFVVAPGHTQPGSRCSRPVTLTDVYPTLCDLAGLPTPGHLEGQSFLSLLHDPQGLREQPGITSNSKGDSFRTDDWRYIRYQSGIEELYDHRSDPGEYDNVAYDPQYLDVLNRHRELARKSLHRTPPTGQTPPDSYTIDDAHRIHFRGYVPIDTLVRELARPAKR